MRLTRRGSIVLAILGMTAWCTAMYVAVMVPESAGAILAIMLLICFGWLLKRATDSWTKGSKVIADAEQFQRDCVADKMDTQLEMSKSQECIEAK